MPVRKKPTKSVVETTVSKQDIITMLTKSPHGDLMQYKEPVEQAVFADADFLAHLIAWNQRKGAIRDSKLALPFWVRQITPLDENALAHLALQSPRQLVQLIKFAQTNKVTRGATQFWKMIGHYLKAREMFPAWFTAVALQHRESLKTLYALSHTAPNDYANSIVFKRQYPEDSVFYAVQHLSDFSAQEIGGMVERFRIPYLVARGALGVRMRESDVLMAVVERMSPTELVTNIKALQKLGATNFPAVKAAMGKGLARAGKSRANVLKTTQAAQAIAQDDPDSSLVVQLEDVQERQLERMIDGNWLILADKSGSMQSAIVGSVEIAGLLAHAVKGKVSLVFFDTVPHYIDVTQMAYKQISELTAGITPHGGTSIGCGLLCALERRLPIDGIVIASDGGENNEPQFAQVYVPAFRGRDVQPPVYFYKFQGESDRLSARMQQAQIDFQTFDLQGQSLDRYSLPNLVQTMSVKRYRLTDAIYDTPLLTLEQALRPPRQFVRQRESVGV